MNHRVSSIYLIVALLSFSAQGHEAIDKQIFTLNQRLAVSPEDYRLYLRRAELYRRHKQWDLALGDFTRVERLEPGNYDSVLGRAQVQLDKTRPEICLQILDGLIQRQPDLARGHFVRGRALMALNKGLDAAKAFSRGIELLDAPRPDHYLERARALASDPNRIIDAIHSIDDGLTHLKHNLSLEQFATELEVLSRRYESALSRIDRVLNVYRQLPFWLVRKAEVLVYLGRFEEARKNYQAAAEGISRLPIRRQKTPAMVNLRTRIEQALRSAGKRKR